MEPKENKHLALLGELRGDIEIVWGRARHRNIIQESGKASRGVVLMICFQLVHKLFHHRVARCCRIIKCNVRRSDECMHVSEVQQVYPTVDSIVDKHLTACPIVQANPWNGSAEPRRYRLDGIIGGSSSTTPARNEPSSEGTNPTPSNPLKLLLPSIP
jgi:hypothetical protein